MVWRKNLRRTTGAGFRAFPPQTLLFGVVRDGEKTPPDVFGLKSGTWGRYDKRSGLSGLAWRASAVNAPHLQWLSRVGNVAEKEVTSGVQCRRRLFREEMVRSVRWRCFYAQDVESPGLATSTSIEAAS